MKFTIKLLLLLLPAIAFAQMQASNNNVSVVGALPGGSNVIGHVITDSGSVVAATLAAETTKVIGTVNQGTSPWVANVSQINGVTALMGNGATGTGSLRVTLANDSSAIAGWGLGATGSAVPTGSQYMSGNGSGNLIGLTVCDSSAFLDMTSATTTQIVALSSSKLVRVCSLSVETNGTTVVTFKYGTGSNCGTGTTSLGPAWDFTAQTGISQGSGIGQLFATAASNALCVTNSAAVNTHVMVSYTVF